MKHHMPSYQCPCGSKTDYNFCCKPYIFLNKLAETPEKLMRSRYTAFCLVNIDYIKKTMKYNALLSFNETSTKEWASRITWGNLKILDSTMENENLGYVEFIASFIDYGKPQNIHEKSKFIKEKGAWYYVDGVHY